MIQNPLSKNYAYIESDQELMNDALNGSKVALETLISRHQNYIYNVALRLVFLPHDAEDLTQEVLIIVITKLSQFKGNSSFRTWLYRIVFNHFLRMDSKRMEKRGFRFEGISQQLDTLPGDDLSILDRLEKQEKIEEAKITCMTGMLLCLNREQRLVFILGELFNVDHNLGAELLEITKDNYRKKLSRARKDLYRFMNNQCGLINEANTCRCSKKARGFIKMGFVDTNTNRFAESHKDSIANTVAEKLSDFSEQMESKFADLFRNQPFYEKEFAAPLLKGLLKDNEFRSIFDL